MKYKFFATSESAWDGMLSAIRSAKKSIYWESYIILNDTGPTHNFFGTLAEKARSGVSVKIVIDAVGGYMLERKDITFLKNAGVEIILFERWFGRVHKKILIVDETTGFIGGVNVGKPYINWLDIQVRISGTLVKYLTRSFARMYALSGGKDEYLLKLSKSVIRERTQQYRLIEQWPIKKLMPIYAAYKSRLARAKKSITLVTPYFYPHGWLTRALKKATDRGVSVTIIMPQNADNRILTFLNYLFVDAHRCEGIRFLFTREMIHAKVLLVDGKEALVGSQNLDAQSFDFNIEAGILFEREDMVGDLAKILTDWIKESMPIEMTGFKKKWYHYLLSPIVWILQPVL